MESVIPFSSIAIFFCSEIKLVEKGKNKIKSKLLLQFVYDVAVDFIKGKVKATMKKNVYDVQNWDDIYVVSVNLAITLPQLRHRLSWGGKELVAGGITAFYRSHVLESVPPKPFLSTVALDSDPLYKNMNHFIPQQIQVRQKWADWRMARDVRKRRTQAEYAVSKLRVNALRKNDILPKEIVDIADKEIAAFPRDAVGLKIRARCGFTSRGNGNVLRWHVSRIVFRDLADRNLLSGIQRAMW